MKVKEAVVNKTVAQIYLQPSKTSEMADEAIYGMVVELDKELQEGWYYIKTKYDYEGYMHIDDLYLNFESILAWKEKAHHEICHNVVDVMSSPSYKGYQLKLLVRGSLVKSLDERKDNWSKISLVDGTTGWVRQEFLKVVTVTRDQDEDRLRKSLVDTALKYLNTQYRWGGRSPLGIDCSGLCSISYLLNGITIYRDAKLKDKYLRPIPMEEVKGGDLLFFPGHVAMYIGEGKFIHSSASINGVNINSLNQEDSDYREDLKDQLYAIGTIF